MTSHFNEAMGLTMRLPPSPPKAHFPHLTKAQQEKGPLEGNLGGGFEIYFMFIPI